MSSGDLNTSPHVWFTEESLQPAVWITVNLRLYGLGCYTHLLGEYVKSEGLYVQMWMSLAPKDALGSTLMLERSLRRQGG